MQIKRIKFYKKERKHKRKKQIILTPMKYKKGKQKKKKERIKF